MRQRGNEDVSKLPKWAQRRLQVLEENAEASYKEAYAATTEGESNTSICDYSAMGKLRGLPPYSRIRFGTDRDWIEVRLLNPTEEHLEADEVVVEVHSGTGRVVVFPRVSNSVYVKVT